MTSSGGAQGSARVNLRRARYIKPAFQRQFVVQFGLLLVMGCVLVAACVYGYATRTLTTAFVDSKLRVMSTADFLLPALALAALLVSALVALVAAVRLLIFSHRIAGPLYRLEQTTQAIGSGHLNLHVRLRSGDQLQELAHSMDEMVTELRTQAQRMHEQTRQLGELIRQAKAGAQMGTDWFRALEDTQGRLDDAINRFHL